MRCLHDSQWSEKEVEEADRGVSMTRRGCRRSEGTVAVFWKWGKGFSDRMEVMN
jgi:hypothetical protein